MARIRRRSFKNYSGPMIVGDAPVPPPQSSLCLDRQHYLTTKVETGGTYGTVVMFDGTTVTAGPDQFILTYPRELAHEDFNAKDDQGPLPKLLRRLEVVPGLECEVEALWEHFEKAGWYVSRDGRLRYNMDQEVRVGKRKKKVTAGDIVHGAVLRDTITPTGGKVPVRGPDWEDAKKWCLLFHELMINPAGFRTQNEYGAEFMLKGYKRRRLKLEGRPTVEEAVFGSEVSAISVGDVGPEVDLAMAFWYSNSVNAPAIAMRCLADVLVKWNPEEDREQFAQALIRRMGKARWGRWNAKHSGGRYQRTRKWAAKSGLWPREFFRGKNALMPYKL